MNKCARQAWARSFPSPSVVVFYHSSKKRLLRTTPKRNRCVLLCNVERFAPSVIHLGCLFLSASRWRSCALNRCSGWRWTTSPCLSSSTASESSTASTESTSCMTSSSLTSTWRRFPRTKTVCWRMHKPTQTLPWVEMQKKKKKFKQ